jgi:two-component system, sensor histidine kinase
VSAANLPPFERVLVCTADARDARWICELLTRAGIHWETCGTAEEVCRQAAEGASAAVFAEEVLDAPALAQLLALHAAQPLWSDLPLVVLTPAGGTADDDQRRLAQFEPLGKVTFVEKPVRVVALVSAVRTALRARRRQYQVRDHLAERLRVEEQLREIDRRKNEFLAMLAHELRNPLAPIRNALHMLRLLAPGDTELAWPREVIERQVQHLSRLVDDLLDVSRITRGTLELRREPIDLADVVARAVETSRPWIDSRRHTLTVTVPPEAIRVEADMVRLTQVIGNLLANAAKYTDEGGRIALTVECGPAQAVVRVRDSGVGIPPEMLGKIFEMFMQIDPSVTRSDGGLGIGLMLVKRLVEMHGGTVEAHSDGPGQGSEFVLRLPRCPPLAG